MYEAIFFLALNKFLGFPLRCGFTWFIFLGSESCAQVLLTEKNKWPPGNLRTLGPEVRKRGRAPHHYLILIKVLPLLLSL